MKLRLLFVVSLLVTAFGYSAIQAADDYVVPRTEYGQPDLQGVWNFSSNTPMQRAREFGEKEFLTEEDIEKLRAKRETTLAAAAEREAGPQSGPAGVGGYNSFWFEVAGRGDNPRTSLITYPKDGRVPAIIEGVKKGGGGLGPDTPGDRPVLFVVGGIAKDGPEDRGLSERCMIGFNSGPPFTPSLYNNNLQIFQSKDTVVLMTEMIHDARIVPLDGRPHIDDSIRQWTGDSRGYWDGDTLVVETRNFTAWTQSFDASGDAYDKLLTERFTRVDEYTVNYEFTIEDPSTFTDKITALVPMAKLDGLLYEYACHEGNYGMVNTLRGARREERDALEASGAN